jgi:hypothetical protein
MNTPSLSLNVDVKSDVSLNPRIEETVMNTPSLSLNVDVKSDVSLNPQN